MPRNQRRRGKEIKLRGISHEQIYVTSAIDRIGKDKQPVFI